MKKSADDGKEKINNSFETKKENNIVINKIILDHYKTVKICSAFNEKHNKYKSKGDENKTPPV